MKQAALPFVLAGKPQRVESSLQTLRSDVAKKAARFWIGKEAYALRKDGCIERLSCTLRDGKRVAEVVAGLPADQRAVLAVVRRFGGSISGALLRYELLARGIAQDRPLSTRSRSIGRVPSAEGRRSPWPPLVLRWGPRCMRENAALEGAPERQRGRSVALE